MTFRQFLHTRTANWLLALVSTLIFLIIIEFTMWRPNLKLIPLTLQQQLGYLEILGQSSKKGTVPEPGYIAIIGDSYAEGLGDWLSEELYNGNPPYSASHVLQGETGRDVLSFGFRGGQPAWTLTFELTAALNGVNRYHGIELPAAGDVFAYFYEGNDINDLMVVLNHGMPEWVDPARIGERETVRRYVRELAEAGRKRAYRRWTWAANLSMADTFGRLVKLASKNIRKSNVSLLSAEDPSFRYYGYKPDWTRYQKSNDFVLAGGQRVPYPSPTVEPFVFHSADEIALAGLYFEESLDYLKTQFPAARIHVVYIPTPLNVYEPAQDDYPMHDRIRRANHTEEAAPIVRVSRQSLARVSNATCAAVQAAARAQGVDFIDTRAALREASGRLGYLHGPNDVGHFNRQGYQALAGILKAGLQSDKAGSCTDLAEK